MDDQMIDYVTSVSMDEGMTSGQKMAIAGLAALLIYWAMQRRQSAAMEVDVATNGRSGYTSVTSPSAPATQENFGMERPPGIRTIDAAVPVTTLLPPRISDRSQHMMN